MDWTAWLDPHYLKINGLLGRHRTADSADMSIFKGICTDTNGELELIPNRTYPHVFQFVPHTFTWKQYHNTDLSVQRKHMRADNAANFEEVGVWYKEWGATKELSGIFDAFIVCIYVFRSFICAKAMTIRISVSHPCQCTYYLTQRPQFYVRRRGKPKRFPASFCTRNAAYKPTRG